MGKIIPTLPKFLSISQFVLFGIDKLDLMVLHGGNFGLRGDGQLPEPTSAGRILYMYYCYKLVEESVPRPSEVCTCICILVVKTLADCIAVISLCISIT